MAYKQITTEDLEAEIEGVQYLQVEETTFTICVIRTRSKLVIVGESAFVNPAEYDPELGQSQAFDNATNKLWATLSQARILTQAKCPLLQEPEA